MYTYFIDNLFPGGEFEFIELNGKQVLKLGKHTYSKYGTSNYYCCSRKISMKCDSKLVFDKNWKMKNCYLVHNHEPPMLYKLKDGKYVKSIIR